MEELNLGPPDLNFCNQAGVGGERETNKMKENASLIIACVINQNISPQA